MYNPDQLELPDFEDQRLTEYVYGYDVPFIHAVAYNSEEFAEPPFIGMEFWTPFKVRVPFHFMMWPDTPTIIESQRFFNLEDLDPSGPTFPTVEAELWKELGVVQTDHWKPDFSRWFEEASSEGYDQLAILKYRVRYEWTIRAWQGLTLDYLEQELQSTEEALEFTKDFAVPEGALLLETLEPDDPARRPNTLEIQRGEHPMLSVNTFKRTETQSQKVPRTGIWKRIFGNDRF